MTKASRVVWAGLALASALGLPACKRGRKGERPVPPAPTHAGVRYGPHPRQFLDLWRAPGEGPRPLVVSFHGGGFVEGDRSDIPPLFCEEALARGMSFASAGYRLVGDGGTCPVPQQDGARAIQFLRFRAGEWNLDPKRIGVFGSSAGAGIALWAAYHDDLLNALGIAWQYRHLTDGKRPSARREMLRFFREHLGTIRG